MDDYANYRTAHRDGLTIRQIARTFHVSRRKARDALTSPEPRPYTRTKPPPAPVLGPFQAVIDQVLRDDEEARRGLVRSYCSPWDRELKALKVE